MSETSNDSPYLTTAEAARYLRFKSNSGIRSAVHRGELVPAGAGPHGTHLFRRTDLDAFIARRARSRGRVQLSNPNTGADHATPQGNHQDRAQEIPSPSTRHRPANGQTARRQTDLSRQPARRPRHANDTTRADRPGRTATVAGGPKKGAKSVLSTWGKGNASRLENAPGKRSKTRPCD